MDEQRGGRGPHLGAAAAATCPACGIRPSSITTISIFAASRRQDFRSAWRRWPTTFSSLKDEHQVPRIRACGIAGIYSEVEVHSSCVRHGETGLFVPIQPADWYRAMRQLIDDPDFRQNSNGRPARTRKIATHKSVLKKCFWSRSSSSCCRLPSKSIAIDACACGSTAAAHRGQQFQFASTAIGHIRHNGLRTAGIRFVG